jgi:hypothetical protein
MSWYVDRLAEVDSSICLPSFAWWLIPDWHPIQYNKAGFSIHDQLKRCFTLSSHDGICLLTSDAVPGGDNLGSLLDRNSPGNMGFSMLSAMAAFLA